MVSSSTMPIDLIGTVHLDPQGYQRLSTLLETLNPQFITVEVSPYAIKYRRTAGLLLRKQLEAFHRPDGSFPPALDAVEAQLQVPFEYQAAADYARITRSKIKAIGDSRESKQLLNLLERELMPTDNLIALALRDEPPLSEQVEQAWRVARQQFRSSRPISSDDRERLQRSNVYLAKKIRSLFMDERLIHIGGWEHLHGLGEQLLDLKPRLHLLCG